MALSVTTINENGNRWRYAVPRRVVQKSPRVADPKSNPVRGTL